jgi:arginyl-tRNA synthetase
VTTYLTELASTFNSWYASERLIGGENPEYGLLLTQATEKVLATGLEVLGIRAPEEM